jgi:putative redox protein
LLAGRPFVVRKSFVDDLARHNLASRIALLRIPLLVLHSPLDATVGIENAARIFAVAKHPKSFISLDNADHLLTRRADADYAAAMIATWASRYRVSEP